MNIIKQNLINLLPDEIISKILSYTYNIQPDELLNDIKSFYNTKYIIQNNYIITYNLLVTRYNWYENYELNKNYIDFIVDELYFFMNTKMNSKILHNYILERTISCKTYEDAKIYLKKLLLLGKDTQLNILCGILKPYERKLFIKKMDIFYT